MTTKKVYVVDGVAIHLTDDTLTLIMAEASGGPPKHVSRLGNVDWDEKTGQWVSVDVKDGSFVAAHQIRGECIRLEIAHYENLIERDPDAFIRKYITDDQRSE